MRKQLKLEICPRCLHYISDILFPYRSPSPRPRPDPTQHPEMDPKRTRNGAETEPNGAKRSRNGAKRSRNGPKSSPLGWDGRGGLSGWRGVGVVREKENHYITCSNELIMVSILVTSSCVRT